MVEKSAIMAPRSRVLTVRIRRYPNLLTSRVAALLAMTAPMVMGIMVIPAFIGEYPIPIWRSNGVRKGIAPLPSRANRFPRMPTEKFLTLKRSGEKSGIGCHLEYMI